ncbi:hypothetical protein VD0002_g6389 [Verticillium dahliae]|uniref:Uncharacterized protein n=1 Tax=Verticillium dahliae TaxID=27337 RepID=A0AA44WP64_VERDA|nr:hypothetical protein BJF96_g1947 [Verticillium dahliae]PNH61415.1 hypothetical protein VD0002_g6389 [Verticillium dahliae]
MFFPEAAQSFLLSALIFATTQIAHESTILEVNGFETQCCPAWFRCGDTNS